MPARPAPAFLLPILLALTAGCGGSGTPMTQSASPYTFSGDWGTRLPPGVAPGNAPIGAFVGTLSASNGMISGMLTPLFSNSIAPACGSTSFTPAPVSGTIDSGGNLTLTLPVGGGTATLTATLSTNPETLVNGMYKVTGGTCAMPSTAMQIGQFAPLTGTYSGTFNAVNLLSGQPLAGTSTAITAVLTQSTTPNSNGQFPITGMVTVTGACSASFSFSSDSFVWGGNLLGFGDPSYGLGAASDPAGISAIALFTNDVGGKQCPYNNQYTFEGTLTRQ